MTPDQITAWLWTVGWLTGGAGLVLLVQWISIVRFERRVDRAWRNYFRGDGRE